LKAGELLSTGTVRQFQADDAGDDQADRDPPSGAGVRSPLGGGVRFAAAGQILSLSTRDGGASGRWGRRIPVKAGPALVAEPQVSSGDPPAGGYTDDRNSGHPTATVDRADAARPGCSVASTALRSAGQVPGGRRAKSHQDQRVPVNHGG